MAFLFDAGIFSVEGLSGEILPGTKLYWYESGTSTPLATYSNEALTTPNANPVLSDSEGRFPSIWLQDASYKLVMELPNGTQRTRDPIRNPGDGVFVSYTDLASTDPTKGSNLIGWMQAGIGAVARSLAARMRDDIFVTDFLDPIMWGLASYDAAPGIRAMMAAHPGKRYFFPNPREQYTLGSSLGEAATGSGFHGAGHRTCKLVRGYSAADYLLVVGESVSLKDIWFDGNSQNFTGGGIQVKLGTGRQIARDVRIINFASGIPLNFRCTGASSAQASGSQSEWTNLEAWRADSSAGLERYAVVHDDPAVNTAGHPISFVNFNSSGYESIDFGPCNNWYVTNSNLFTFKTNDRGVGVSISTTRISEGAGGAFPITLTGAGSMTGVHCFPELIFSNQSGNSWSFVGGYMNSGYTDLNPNSTTTIFDRTLNSYVPTWLAGATPITIGAGSSAGTWQRHGTIITFNARLVIGADTVLPAGNITVSLPSKCNSGISAQCMVSGHMQRGSTMYKFSGRIVSGELVARLERDTSGPITSTVPGALASGDVIQISGLYSR